MNRRFASIALVIFLGGAIIGYFRLRSEPGALPPTETPSETQKTTGPADSASPSASASAQPSAVNAAVNPKDLRRVTELIQKARASLPKMADLRGKTSEEMHSTPTSVLDSGRALGKLADFLKRHPETIKEALPLYRDCAADAQIVEAIRAVCIYRLSLYEKEWDAETREVFKTLAPEIRDLAKSLDGT